MIGLIVLQYWYILSLAACFLYPDRFFLTVTSPAPPGKPLKLPTECLNKFPVHYCPVFGMRPSFRYLESGTVLTSCKWWLKQPVEKLTTPAQQMVVRCFNRYSQLLRTMLDFGNRNVKRQKHYDVRNHTLVRGFKECVSVYVNYLHILLSLIEPFQVLFKPVIRNVKHLFSYLESILLKSY